MDGCLGVFRTYLAQRVSHRQGRVYLAVLVMCTWATRFLFSACVGQPCWSCKKSSSNLNSEIEYQFQSWLYTKFYWDFRFSG